MKIAIVRNEENIVAVKDYSDIKDRGEVAHIMAELESIKLDLLDIWEDFEDEN